MLTTRASLGVNCCCGTKLGRLKDRKSKDNSKLRQLLNGSFHWRPGFSMYSSWLKRLKKLFFLENFFLRNCDFWFVAYSIFCSNSTWISWPKIQIHKFPEWKFQIWRLREAPLVSCSRLRLLGTRFARIRGHILIWSKLDNPSKALLYPLLTTKLSVNLHDVLVAVVHRLKRLLNTQKMNFKIINFL